MISWPAARVGEALDALVRVGAQQSKSVEIPILPPAAIVDDPRRLGMWIESAAASVGLETESAEIRYLDAERRLASAAPALLRSTDGSLLALLDTGVVIAPDLTVRRVGQQAIRAQLCHHAESPLEGEINQFLDSTGIPERRRPRVREALLRQRLARQQVGHCWSLRLPPGASFALQLRLARVPQKLLLLAGAHVVQYAIWLAAWWLIGVGALQGRLDSGTILAWLLLLLTLIPIRGLITWLQGVVAITAGGILRERLLSGALRLESNEVRHQGAGQLLGRVIEAAALESLALSGGFLALVAVIELVFAVVVLSAGAAGGWHALPLVLWTALAGLLGWRYFQEQRRWADARLWMTHDLVERMVGHRTRLAQQPRQLWHDAEDQQLQQYLSLSQSMDRKAAWLMAIVPRGWLVIGVAGLAPAFIAGASPAALAIGVGGVLLGYRAFRRLTSGMWYLTEAAIAWKQVAPLFDAAARAEPSGSPIVAVMDTAPQQETVIEARDLVFRYADRAEPVLRRCNLSVAAGDRLLVEGASGEGKSTLALLLSGVLRPQSGLLLARGLDRQTLGRHGWLRRVASAPQFHDNHVFTGTFEFNLLLARNGWRVEEDYREAEAICRELGLGPLLEKMPAGMLQMVGEGGWQLSHGERSRLYVARALLQGADVLIFDESFAALDPENLRLSLDCVLKRAPTVLVIAHP